MHPDLPDASRWARMAALHEEVADRVADQVRVGRVPAVRRIRDTGRGIALSVGCTWCPDEVLDAEGGSRARLLTALLADPS